MQNEPRTTARTAATQISLRGSPVAALWLAGLAMAGCYLGALLRFPLLSIYAEPIQNLAKLTNSNGWIGLALAVGVLALFLSYGAGALALAESRSERQGRGALLALLGVWRLINTFMAAIVWPNTQRFNTSVRDGSLDYMLLQPVSSQFLVSFSRMVLWRVWDIALAIILIVAGLTIGGDGVEPLQLANFLLLTVTGGLILYSLWIVLIACTFWFVKFDNNVTILQALLDAGRYPATVYPAWLRLIVTFIVPIAVATTVPLQALRGELLWWQVLMFVGISAASLIISRSVWLAGVRRYSGASS